MSAEGLAEMRTPKQRGERTKSAPLFGRINIGSIRAMTAMFAIFMLSTGIAHAQFSFWPHGHHAPFKHKRHHRQANSESAQKVRPEAPAKGPLQIIISIADQRVSLFDKGVLIARSSVSTGTRGASHAPRRVQRDRQTTMAPFKYL